MLVFLYLKRQRRLDVRHCRIFVIYLTKLYYILDDIPDMDVYSRVVDEIIEGNIISQFWEIICFSFGKIDYEEDFFELLLSIPIEERSISYYVFLEMFIDKYEINVDNIIICKLLADNNELSCESKEMLYLFLNKIRKRIKILDQNTRDELREFKRSFNKDRGEEEEEEEEEEEGVGEVLPLNFLSS